MMRSIILILLVLMAISCRSTKKPAKQPIKSEGPEYLFRKLKENEFKFEWLRAKFGAELKSDQQSPSFSGQLRIRRDSLIWISVSKFSIEAFRLIISPDSVRMINRLDKTYMLEDFSYMNKFVNGALDFDMVQAFLTGNDFSFFENSQFKASIDSKEYKLTTSNRGKLKKYVKDSHGEIKIPIQNIWLNAENFKITKVLIKEVKQEGRKLNATYGNFTLVNEQLFPFDLKFDISAENSAKIKVNYKDIRINEKQSFPFKISKNYSKAK